MGQVAPGQEDRGQSHQYHLCQATKKGNGEVQDSPMWGGMGWDRMGRDGTGWEVGTVLEGAQEDGFGTGWKVGQTRGRD